MSTVLNIHCNFIHNIVQHVLNVIINDTLNSVNFGDCGSIDRQMTEVTSVNTWMRCDRSCFMAVGSDKIYKFTNESFRVYINQLDLNQSDRDFVEFAKNNNYQLHYEIKGRCK